MKQSSHGLNMIRLQESVFPRALEVCETILTVKV